MKQISVFLEDSAKRHGDLIKVIARGNISIKAISVTNSSDLSILRIVVDKIDETMKILNEEGFTTRVADVAAVEVPDSPGSLAKVMELFEKTGVIVENLYTAKGSKENKLVVIFKLEDHQEGLKILAQNGASLVESL